METITLPHKVKARKVHHCNWCGQRIPKGDTYIKSTYVYDGIYDWKAHQHCEELVKHMKLYENTDIHEGVGDSEFHEALNYHYIDLLRPKIKGCDSESTILDHLGYVSMRKKMNYVLIDMKNKV